MKRKISAAPPNVAAKALREGRFRQRIVKAKDSYSRKEKHKKGTFIMMMRPFFFGRHFMREAQCVTRRTSLATRNPNLQRTHPKVANSPRAINANLMQAASE